MYIGRNFDPADTEESETYSFDFANDLLVPGEVLVSATFQLEIARSSPVPDPSAAAKLAGPATVGPAFSGGPNTVASQRIGPGLVQRGMYYLQAIAVTSVGNTRALSAYIPVEDQH